MEQLIRLFKAVEVKTKDKKYSDKLLKLTIPKGFVFSPVIIANYTEEELIELTTIIENELYLSATQMNSSFHKSWKKVQDASIEQLVIEQLMHYITTYGYEQLGCYDEDLVYIPHEKLEIPELTDDIKLTIINGYTKDEIKTKLLLMLKGIALSNNTIKDVVTVATHVGITASEIEQIKNKEVSCMLFDHLDLIPENPIELLRLAVYKSTGTTLLIKSPELIEQIKSSKPFYVYLLFRTYNNKYAIENLAQIFYRYKPLFLAFRLDDYLKSIVNEIRRLARKHHKPMKEDYLNDLTGLLKRDPVYTDFLQKELSKVNIYRKIRLAYALKFRTTDADSIVYRIRNGKSYAKSFSYEQKARAKHALATVLESITKDISKNVKGKKIYIPKEITYMLPSTEKQFTGNFPSGSYVTIPKDMIVGIHWENVGSRRVDLDLSMISATNKIGWDGSYRNEQKTILFSGDMTSAPKPKGASELFYIKKQGTDAHILMVNYFNYRKDVEVPFKIIVAKNKMESIGMNYMIDPNDVVSIAKSKITQKQKILGFIVTTPSECRFYFAETHIGKDISAGQKDYILQSKKYLFDFYTNAISLNEMLIKAGAIESNKDNCDINLSQENLAKDTLINLIS